MTCAGRRVAMVRAFANALQHLGAAGQVMAADISPVAAACLQADRAFQVPRCDDPAYIDALLDIVANHDIRLLVPQTDLDLLALAKRQDAFAEQGCTVMIGTPEAVGICRDKAATAAFFDRAGVPGIRTITLEAFRADPFWPCFAKPPGGSGSIGARRLDHPDELAIHVEKFGPDLVIQEHVGGQEITIDVYKARDGKVHAVVPRQRLAVRSGEVEIGVTIADDELVDAGRRIAESLEGIWGVFCCQCRRPVEGQDRRGRFFEINARFGGGTPLSIAAGADLPRMLLEEVLGLPVSGQPGRFAPNVVMTRFDDAAFRAVDDPSQLPGYNGPIFR